MWKDDTSFNDWLDDAEDDPTANYNWANSKTPWELFSRKKMYELEKRCELRNWTGSTVQLAEPPRYSFRRPAVKNMVTEFFTNHGKPRLARLGHEVDYYILWSVTSGMIRMNSHRIMWLYQGNKTEILDLKRKCNKLWSKVETADEILFHVTDACNDVKTALIRELSTRTLKDFLKARLENLKRLPPFVACQTELHRDNKRYFNHIGKKPSSGHKKRSKPQKSDVVERLSVHKMLQTYHDWLPSMRNTEADN